MKEVISNAQKADYIYRPKEESFSVFKATLQKVFQTTKQKTNNNHKTKQTENKTKLQQRKNNKNK